MLGRIARSQRGAFMVFFAILVPFFLGMIGFAVDAGFVYMQKAKMQDIADAAALAGAARLNDSEDRGGHVTSAVKAYITANGMKITATNIKELDEEASLNPNKNNFQVAQGILASVMDKDNVQRDHVRVVIAKRVPTFFIGILLPDEKEGVLVKAAAEAEYVAGEAPVVSGGARIMSGHFDAEQIYDSKTIVVQNGNSFSLYAGNSNESLYKKIPEGTIGTLYNKHEEKDNQGLPDGWNLVRLDKKETDWNLDDPKEKKEKEKSQRAEREYKSLLEMAQNEFYKANANVKDYISGNDPKKRYIGFYNGKFISNIKPTDKEIDLYMYGWYAEVYSYSWNEERVKDMSILTNRQLQNVTKIDNLFFANHGVILTNNITYGNIYTNDGKDITIDGDNNIFNGTVYASQQMWVGGNNTKFAGNGVSLLCNNVLHIGYWDHYTETTDKKYDSNIGATVDATTYVCTKKENKKNDSSWHIYFDSSSSGSGSSGSDSGTSAHVRLVK